MANRINPESAPFAPEIDAALKRIVPPNTPPLVLFTTLARNPRVFQRFMAGSLLDKGTITLREREIAIDRTTARCGSEYEWGAHVALLADRVGLTPAQIAATRNGPADDPVWTPRERLVLALVDALHDTHRIDDMLWQKLRTEFSDEQLIELVVLTGLYHMVSFVTNALALPLEPYSARFPT
jgi:alkylhydroperoxidase family enzyme